MRSLVVFHNPKKDTYYYKFTYMSYRRYKVNDENQYGHKVILIIDSNEVQPIIIKRYVSIRYLVLTPIIFILKKLLVFLQKLNIDY